MEIVNQKQHMWELARVRHKGDQTWYIGLQSSSKITIIFLVIKTLVPADQLCVFEWQLNPNKWECFSDQREKCL